MGEIVMSVFGWGSSGGYSLATIDRIKKNVYISQQNHNMQSWQIQDEFTLTNLTRVELGDHRKLLNILDLTHPTLTYV